MATDNNRFDEPAFLYDYSMSNHESSHVPFLEDNKPSVVAYLARPSDDNLQCFHLDFQTLQGRFSKLPWITSTRPMYDYQELATIPNDRRLLILTDANPIVLVQNVVHRLLRHCSHQTTEDAFFRHPDYSVLIRALRHFMSARFFYFQTQHYYTAIEGLSVVGHTLCRMIVYRLFDPPVFFRLLFPTLLYIIWLSYNALSTETMSGEISVRKIEWERTSCMPHPLELLGASSRESLLELYHRHLAYWLWLDYYRNPSTFDLLTLTTKRFTRCVALWFLLAQENLTGSHVPVRLAQPCDELFALMGSLLETSNLQTLYQLVVGGLEFECPAFINTDPLLWVVLQCSRHFRLDYRSVSNYWHLWYDETCSFVTFDACFYAVLLAQMATSGGGVFSKVTFVPHEIQCCYGNDFHCASHRACDDQVKLIDDILNFVCYYLVATPINSHRLCMPALDYVVDAVLQQPTLWENTCNHYVRARCEGMSLDIEHAYLADDLFIRSRVRVFLANEVRTLMGRYLEKKAIVDQSHCIRPVINDAMMQHLHLLHQTFDT